MGRLNGDEVVQIWSFDGSENFVSMLEELEVDYLEPVKRATDRSDVR